MRRTSVTMQMTPSYCVQLFQLADCLYETNDVRYGKRLKREKVATVCNYIRHSFSCHPKFTHRRRFLISFFCIRKCFARKRAYVNIINISYIEMCRESRMSIDFFLHESSFCILMFFFCFRFFCKNAKYSTKHYREITGERRDDKYAEGFSAHFRSLD